MRELFDAILSLETREETESFFRDLCTLSELEAMAHRWQVRAPAGAGAAVPRDRRADGRVDDDGDARGALAAARRGRLPRCSTDAPDPAAKRARKLRVAVPQGPAARAVVPPPRGRGLGPEQPGDRALAFPCRNAPVEVLLVRAADVPEYVQDGVVDCGITGLDLVRERGADVHELLRLGFGSCRLEVAVPEESPVRAVEELVGAAVATVYLALARELLPIDVTLVDVTGSVDGRAATRAGRCDRRPRLVGEHAADERAPLARRPARVRGRVGRQRR
jgi:ATP phosphoribosyltransferase